jgi:antitoxin component YwqK of YwqJK toxin-antitoxin module
MTFHRAWRITFVVAAFAVIGCTTSADSASDVQVESTDARLSLYNGIYLYDHVPYSGVIVTRYPEGTMKKRALYEAGQQDGLTRTFYATGARRDERRYKRGRASGNHRGWWPNGLRKFDFTYVEDRREGVHRQWYVTGTPYTELTFHLDREDGMQRAFRENGKPYINYEVKDGFKYGLSKSALCASLKNEEVVR